MRKRIKPYFLIWLLFPATWLFFYQLDNPEKPKQSETVFYTSLKAPQGATADLFCGKNFIGRMRTSNNGFTKIEYAIEIKKIDSITLKIEGFTDNDTISFLSINLFHNNAVHTLPENQFHFIKADSAIRCDTSGLLLSFVPFKNAHEITISFNDPLTWESPDISQFKKWILISVFILTLITLFIVNPSFKYLAVTTALTCVFISFYWWIGKDMGSLLYLKNSKLLNEVVFYKDSIPVFFPEPHTFFKGPDTAFRTQVDLTTLPYNRISFNKNVESIQNFSFQYSFGIISKSWNLRTINPSGIIINDVDYNPHASTWKVTGNDPYVSLITAGIIASVDKLLFLRKSLFLFIAAFLFIVSLTLYPLLKNMAIHKAILFSSFFAIIGNALLLWSFNSDKLILDAEKRLAFAPPPFDSLPFNEYGRRLGIYVQDQLPGRNNLIISNNFFKYETFREVSGNPLVYFGKNGWMFYIGENVKEMYENKYPLTPEQLEKMKDVLVERRDWLKQRNIHYYIIFPRLPHFIYNENIGTGLNVYNPKPKLGQLLEYLKQHTDLDVIDVETPILEAKAKYKQNIYYPNDSHWTLFGAYFAYRDIINYIRKDFPNMPPPIPFNEIKWIEKDDNDADLAQLLCLNTIIKRHEYIPINNRVEDFKQITAPDYPEFQSIHPMQFYTSKNSLAPKLIMNRDSYSNFLIPFFATNFNRQGYLWTPLFYRTVIEKEKPDIVITEMQERFIYDLLKTSSTSPDVLKTLTGPVNGE